MTGRTSIEWTWPPGYQGSVWNPTVGCTRVSDGCQQCYAFALHDQRYAANRRVALALPYDREKGAGGPYTPAGARHTHPELVGVKGGLSRSSQYDLPFSSVQLLPDRLDVPLRTKKPTCYFVDSMADLFHEDVTDAFLDDVFGTMEKLACARHRFLILTKRPERMQRYLDRRWAPNDLWRDGFRPEHIWLGTSVEDQRSADERIPHLLGTAAAVRFLSCEPLLGPVDLSAWSSGPWCANCGDGSGWGAYCCAEPNRVEKSALDWVIVGGESGSRARPMDLAWARSLMAQCRAAGVAVFVKQLGSKPVGRTVAFTRTQDHEGSEGFEGKWVTVPIKLREPHGRDMDEWPEDLRVREWPR